MFRRQEDFSAHRRLPPVDSGIGVGDFLRGDAVPSADIEQRVALFGRVGHQRADDVLTAPRQGIRKQRPVREIGFFPLARQAWRRVCRRYRHGQRHNPSNQCFFAH